MPAREHDSSTYEGANPVSVRGISTNRRSRVPLDNRLTADGLLLIGLTASHPAGAMTLSTAPRG